MGGVLIKNVYAIYSCSQCLYYYISNLQVHWTLTLQGWSETFILFSLSLSLFEMLQSLNTYSLNTLCLVH